MLELIEGPTLADRIAKGPIPVDEALPIAMQIAEALEAAHEQGIIHRDLKPANIKLKPDGTVKVLDFGLAKAFDTTPRGDPDQSPTLTAAATQMGVIMGTAAYMSPEQARGKPVDKRADIWAFGVVLYEMLTGRRPFQGDEVSLTLASVMKSEVDATMLPVDLPAGVRTVIRQCLQKEPRQRIHDIADARLALGGAFESGRDDSGVGGPPPSPLRAWQRPVPLAAALFLVAIGALGSYLTTTSFAPGTPASPPPVERFELTTPPGAPVSMGPTSSVAISPDGSRVAYLSGSRVSTGGVLYVRRLDALDVTRVEGAEDLSFPFFSPDGESVGFLDRGDVALRRVPFEGGLVRVIARPDEASVQGFGIASWGADDTIVMTSNSGGLLRVQATGGEVERVTTPTGGAVHTAPTVLPDGRTVLFVIRRSGENAIAAASLDTGEVTPLIDEGTNPRYVNPGYLVYSLVGTLMATAFDPATLAVTGTPVPVLEQVGARGHGAAARSQQTWSAVNSRIAPSPRRSRSAGTP